jgi:hypothetical protein
VDIAAVLDADRSDARIRSGGNADRISGGVTGISGGGRDGNVAAVRHTDWAATNGEHTAGSTHRRGARNIISPLFSMLMGLLTLAVAKMPKLSLPPLAAMSPQLTILTGLSPNLVSTLMPLTISSLPMAVISPVLSTLIGPLA